MQAPPAQSQAAYSYGQQQMAPNPYAMWPQAMSNPYGGASQFMYPGYMVRAPAHTPRLFQNAAPDEIFVNRGSRSRPFFF
mmetsp:Transcript_3020/g.11243  ORF Transcript_3020/g.11243 Transcript_3020/m.11243 type:complete len:80 (+) Transcript_3020:312-551(+)